MLSGEQVVSLVRSYAFKSDVQLGAASPNLGKAAIADDVRGTEQN
jgi:hypothetical protein